MTTTSTTARFDEVDFLPDLLGPLGNVHLVFARIGEVCDIEGPFTYQGFRDELDDRSETHSYEDVLALVEEWFGPQEAVAAYHAHMASMGADRDPSLRPRDA